MENFDPKGFVHLKYHNEVTIKHIVLHMGSSLIYWQPKWNKKIQYIGSEFFGITINLKAINLSKN